MFLEMPALVAAEWPCGVGGVLVCAGTPRAFFSLELKSDVRSKLGEQHKKQIIFECETLAAVIAFILWSKLFNSRRCILYVDNEGSKFALIKGFADNEVVDKLASPKLEKSGSAVSSSNKQMSLGQSLIA